MFTSSTISAAFAASKFCKKEEIPYVIDIVDRWPEAIFNLFPVYVRPLIKILLWNLTLKMRFICENANAIWGCSKSYLAYGKSFVRNRQDILSYVYYLGYEKLNENSSLVNKAINNFKQKGIDPNDLNIFFVGTVGKFFNLGTVIEAAKEFKRSNKKIKFIIAGTDHH